MKKIALLMAVVLLFTALAGCNGDDNQPPKIQDESNISSSSSEPSSSEDNYSSEENTVSSEESISNVSSTNSTSSKPTSATDANKVYEKPFEGNAAILYNKQTSCYDEIAEQKRLSIVNMENTVQPKGVTRYISYKGNDENDGTSPETAWATFKNLDFEECDTVLFERGGIYRGALKVTSNTTYSSYGTGPKPVFYTGTKNYADKNLWKKTSAENIWAVRVGNVKDIGNIIFDNGKKTALKVLKTYKNLKIDYQFYHHTNTGVLYLYLSEGNPGELFSSIEIATGHGIQTKGNPTNIVIDNICVKYSGLHGISFRQGANNCIIRNCEIGYIGGSMSDDGYGRLGNGIEFVNSYTNCLVENNWVYQCYDTGITFQNCGTTYLLEDNMVFDGNLVEYCVMNFEIFTASATVVNGVAQKRGNATNCRFTNNILRFAGFGWGVHNRIGSTDICTANISFYKGYGTGLYGCENFIIENNILDTSYYSLISVGFPNDPNGFGPTIRNNTYIQRVSEKSIGVWVRKDYNSVAYLYGEKLPASNEQELETAVKTVDTSPTAIIFEQ